MKANIKLIATDMDGTLFNDKKEFPPSFDEKMSLLKEKGITFIAASGRSYPKQKEVFEKYIDDIFFICDNGALIKHQNNTIFTNTMHISGVREIIKVCEKIDGIFMIFCGLKGVWQKETPIDFKQHITSYYDTYHLINDYSEIDDEILKIAICDLNGSANNSFKILEPIFGENYSIAVSGEVWMDIMNKGVNKGLALKFLQERLNISKLETMAFGDFYNDIEMLKNSEYSFVMENANEDMKQYGKYIAPSNNDDGVMKMIEKYVL